MIVLRTLVFTTILFLACWSTLPPVVTAGGQHHGGGVNGIDILLATGMVAKLLQKKKHGYGARSNQVPVGGRANESPYGSQSMRIMVPLRPNPPPPPPSMNYQTPMQQPQPTVTYSHSSNLMPQQQMPQQTMAQRSYSQSPVVQSSYSSSNYPAPNAQQTTVYGYFTEVQPRDQMEIVHM